MEYKKMLMQQRVFFNTGMTRNVKWRKAQLKALYCAIKNHHLELKVYV